MMDLIRTTIGIFQEYSGSSMYTLLFLCSLFFLWGTENDRDKKVLVVYLMVAIFALFFFPFFAYLGMNYFLDDGVYYRFLWLLPMGVIVCYSVTKLVAMMETKVRKCLVGFLCAVFIIGSGSFIYSNPAITKTNNSYHLPDSVIAVAEELIIEEEYVKAVVPSEMIQFIRQYDAMILMPYGREILIDSWAINHELYELMESPSIYWTYLETLCKESEVDYIVLHESAEVYGRSEEDRFVKITSTSGYDIYMDKESPMYSKRVA